MDEINQRGKNLKNDLREPEVSENARYIAETRYGLKDETGKNTEKVKEELADIFSFAFLLANKYQFNVKDIVLEKIQKNAEKYPVDKAKGTAKKEKSSENP